MSKKITFVGAGSIGFTRKLVGDILTVPEFRDLKISFTDINKNNLDMVAQLCQRDIIANGLDIKIHSTLNRREALEGADYVFNVVRIGGIEAFGTDVESHEVRCQPVRRRHPVRGRNNVWPKRNLRHIGFLQGHTRGCIR